MTAEKLNFRKGVTLVGGAPAASVALDEALRLAPHLVAADGGANQLAAALPEAIIGDLDSLENQELWRERIGERLIHVAEQDSTDFEKCLRLIDAPFLIGVGFTGGRFDHGLAALHALVAEHRPVVLLSDTEVIVSLAQPLEIAVQVGDRVSLFPLRPVTGHAEGLRWPVERLAMEAGRRIGTSNEAAAARVRLEFDRPGAVAIFEARRLRAVLDALSVTFD